VQDRWTLPNLWYSIPGLTSFPGFSIAFITIDTDILAGSYSQDQKETDVPKKQEQQYDWIRAELTKAQNYDYIIVAGHHPVFSVSSHGDERFLMDTLYPMLKDFDVSLYISGHDHNLQATHSQYHSRRSDSDQTMQFAVSGMGAGSSCDKDTALNGNGDPVSNDFFYCGDGGFVQLVADRNSLKVHHLAAQNEKVLFTQTISKRLPSRKAVLSNASSRNRRKFIRPASRPRLDWRWRQQSAKHRALYGAKRFKKPRNKDPRNKKASKKGIKLPRNKNPKATKSSRNPAKKPGKAPKRRSMLSKKPVNAKSNLKCQKGSKRCLESSDLRIKIGKAHKRNV